MSKYRAIQIHRNDYERLKKYRLSLANQKTGENKMKKELVEKELNKRLKKVDRYISITIDKDDLVELKGFAKGLKLALIHLVG